MGVVATVAGKQVNQSVDVKKIVNIVHAGIQGVAEGEEGMGQGDTEGRRDENGKADRPASSSSAAIL